MNSAEKTEVLRWQHRVLYRMNANTIGVEELARVAGVNVEDLSRYLKPPVDWAPEDTAPRIVRLGILQALHELYIRNGGAARDAANKAKAQRAPAKSPPWPPFAPTGTQLPPAVFPTLDKTTAPLPLTPPVPAPFGPVMSPVFSAPPAPPESPQTLTQPELDYREKLIEQVGPTDDLPMSLRALRERRRRSWASKTVQEVAEAEGLSVPAVRTYAARYDIALRDFNLKTSPKTQTHLVRDRKKRWSGRPVRDIAQSEGISEDAVTAYAAKWDIPIIIKNPQAAREYYIAQEHKKLWQSRTAEEVAKVQGWPIEKVHAYAAQWNIKLKPDA